MNYTKQINNQAEKLKLLAARISRAGKLAGAADTDPEPTAAQVDLVEDLVREIFDAGIALREVERSLIITRDLIRDAGFPKTYPPQRCCQCQQPLKALESIPKVEPGAASREEANESAGI